MIKSVTIEFQADGDNDVVTIDDMGIMKLVFDGEPGLLTPEEAMFAAELAVAVDAFNGDADAD